MRIKYTLSDNVSSKALAELKEHLEIYDKFGELTKAAVLEEKGSKELE